MIKINSLGQKLFIGYIAATVGLIVHIVILDQTEALSMVTKTVASITVISLIFLILHLYFYRAFVRPVHELIRVTSDHAINTNSQLRAKKLAEDELGDLADTFNEMINQIQLREDVIISERDRVAIALEQADNYASMTQQTNHKLALEVQVRKEIEAKLTDFQHFLNSIINSSPSALITFDQSLNITQWNQAARDLSDQDDENALGERLDAALPFLSNHIDWLKDVWKSSETRNLSNIEIDHHGTVIHLELTAYPVKNVAEPSAAVRIDDVTEKIKMEETIVQSEKVMSLGGMAAGMAHEINNPISAIVQNVQNIERRIRTDLEANQNLAREIDIHLDQLNAYLEQRKITSFLKNITESGLRASALVNNMLQFSRGNDLNLHPCRIVEVLEKAITIASTDDQLLSFNKNFELNFDQDFQAPQAYVRGVFTELEQVILNLIKNAAYAIQERRLSINDIDEGIIRVRQFISGEHCVIQVSDNGIGMTPETRRHVFEPFFTTKEVGTGTGLGMSVSYFIITSHHNGSVHVESTAGHGTCFEVSLPLLEENS